MKPSRTVDWVAVILAAGLALAFNTVTFAVLYDAIRSQGPGLSDNATQVLTGLGGGMIGVLGAIVGSKVANGRNTTPPTVWPQRGEENTVELPPR
jgi:hypothetical protein